MRTIILLALLCVGCAEDLCMKPIPQNDHRPDILIIGDSISYGYLPYIQDALPGYDVIHNPCNAKNSDNGVQHIEYWLSLRPSWYAITFNHGAWDVSKGSGISGHKYRTNMEYISHHVDLRTSRPMFIETTHVAVNDTSRFVGSETAYNAIAHSIMSYMNIPVSGINAVSNNNTHLHVNPILMNDSHWQAKGSKLFSDKILDDLSNIYNIY